MSAPTPDSSTRVTARVEVTIRRPGGHNTTVGDHKEVHYPADLTDLEAATRALDEVTDLVKGRVAS